MKKGLCLVLAVLLLALAAGCAPAPASSAPAGGSLRIGVSVYDQYDTFIKLVMERFAHYANGKKLSANLDITIVQQSAEGNQVTQNSQVQNFIESGCDVICVNLVDRTDVSVIIDAAEASNVPVLFFNRELVAEDLQRFNGLYYVGAEAQVSGQLQGQLVADLCTEDFAAIDKNADGVVQYVMLEGEAGHQDAIFRTEYSVNTLAEAGFKVERLDGEIAGWIRARAKSKMAQWLAQYGHLPTPEVPRCIEVVFANNDDMALGAIDALEAAGIPQNQWPVVVGIDGTREGLAAVKSGKMTATVLNDADGQARALVELCCHVRAGTPLPAEFKLTDGKYIRLPYQPITRQNVQTYINIYGP